MLKGRLNYNLQFLKVTSYNYSALNSVSSLCICFFMGSWFSLIINGLNWLSEMLKLNPSHLLWSHVCYDFWKYLFSKINFSFWVSSFLNNFSGRFAAQSLYKQVTTPFRWAIT